MRTPKIRVMSKRSYPTGAQKRKKAAHQKEITESLPKLTSFFKTKAEVPQVPVAGRQQNDLNRNHDEEVENDAGTSNSILSSGSGTDFYGYGNPAITEDPEEVLGQPDNPSGISDAISLFSTDPGTLKAVFTEEIRELWIRKGPEAFQNKNYDFSEASRNYRESSGKIKARNLNKSVFIRKLKNGEIVERKWLLYSPSTKSVFCYSCCLFSTIKTSFSSSYGCNDWKHINNLVLEHENSLAHRQSTITYITRSKSAGRVNNIILSQYKAEVDYWRSVLKRVVAVVKFLSSRGLPFRGDNEILGSQQNGNYLGCIELLGEFDSFLAEHLKKYGNPGKGKTSYLSANICNEFVGIMAKQFLMKIVRELKAAKYYSISIDSTPDLSHVDQLTFIVRYVKDRGPVERFLQFIPINKHTAQYLTDTVLAALKDLDIPIKDCRGQSYDNASNMAGKYSGVQARIKELCEFAIFVPCAGHSLNLVGVHASECVQEATSFFQLVQNVYNFFSKSTHRWNILTECLGSNKVLKSLSETRWSARADAVCALHVGYIKVITALGNIAEDNNQPSETRNEALSLMKKLEKLENVLLTEIWSNILERINKTNLSLQKSTLTMDVAAKLFASLAEFLDDVRSNFERYESCAQAKFPEAKYKDLFQRKTTRSSRIRFFDGPATPVNLSGKEKFKVETFFPIIDTLAATLKQRSESYKEIYQRFGFLSELVTVELCELNNKCQQFAKIYHEDVNANELESECIHFRQYLRDQADQINKSQEITILELADILRKDEIADTFPNLEISVRIFLCLMVTNCSGERSFSKLARIKNELRSTMLQDRLNSLSLMSIENDVLNEIDFEDVINDFAHKKSRKKPLASM